MQSQVKLLDLHRNRLSGTIQDLGRLLPSLVYLDVSSNFFSQWTVKPGFMSHIHTMFLDHNVLITSLATLSISVQFPFLAQLDLSNNQLQGPIPDDWRELSELKELRLVRSGMQQGTKGVPDPLLRGMYLPSFLQRDPDRRTVVKSRDYYYCFGLRLRASDQTSIPADALIEVSPSYFNYSNCLCARRYYGRNRNCTPCPNNAYCPGDYFQEAIVPYQGYWTYAGASWQNGDSFAPSDVTLPDVTALNFLFLPCRRTHAQICSPNLFTPSIDGVTARWRRCSPGYTGRLCGACEDGYMPVGYRCTACPSFPMTIMLLTFYTLLECLFVIYLYLGAHGLFSFAAASPINTVRDDMAAAFASSSSTHHNNRRAPLLVSTLVSASPHFQPQKSLVFFLQMLFYLPYLGLPINSGLTAGVQDVTAIFNFRVSTSVACVFGCTSVECFFFLNMARPFVISAVVFLAFIIIRWKKKRTIFRLVTKYRKTMHQSHLAAQAVGSVDDVMEVAYHEQSENYHELPSSASDLSSPFLSGSDSNFNSGNLHINTKNGDSNNSRSRPSPVGERFYEHLRERYLDLDAWTRKNFVAWVSIISFLYMDVGIAILSHLACERDYVGGATYFTNAPGYLCSNRVVIFAWTMVVAWIIGMPFFVLWFWFLYRFSKKRSLRKRLTALAKKSGVRRTRELQLPAGTARALARSEELTSSAVVFKPPPVRLLLSEATPLTQQALKLPPIFHRGMVREALGFFMAQYSPKMW